MWNLREWSFTKSKKEFGLISMWLQELKSVYFNTKVWIESSCIVWGQKTNFCWFTMLTWCFQCIFLKSCECLETFYSNFNKFYFLFCGKDVQVEKTFAAGKKCRLRPTEAINSPLSISEVVNWSCVSWKNIFYFNYFSLGLCFL